MRSGFAASGATTFNGGQADAGDEKNKTGTHREVPQGPAQYLTRS
jgi:hypothetical protein